MSLSNSMDRSGGPPRFPDRIRNKKRQPDKLVNGVTDHPDRGQMGEWLQYEEGNDPWERSKHAMCNMWHEWDGMRDVVAEERANGAGSAFA